MGEIGSPLEDAFLKFKRIGRPLFGGNTAIKSRIKITNVGLNFNRNEVSLQREIDKIMRYWPKGILQVEPGDVDSPIVCFRVTYDFMQDLIMLNTPVFVFQKCFLEFSIDKIIVYYKVVKSGGSIDPWGTPDMITFENEIELFIETCWVRL